MASSFSVMSTKCFYIIDMLVRHLQGLGYMYS